MKPKRDPVLIVMHALLMGLPVQDGDYTLYLLERETGGRDLFFKYVKGGDEGKEMWLHYEMTFGGFIAMCERMSDEELTLLAMNTALNASKPRKNREGVGA